MSKGGDPVHRHNPRLWITWERHRRTRELSAAFECDLHTLTSGLPYGLRVLMLSLRTTLLLARKRPRLLFVQNPSLVLAALACTLRPLLGYRLVVDRHSNFHLRTLTPPAPVRWVFNRLSRFTNRNADLTVVTNETLLGLVTEWRGRGFVLQDKLPAMIRVVPRVLPGRYNVTFVSSFSADEPVGNVIAAAKLLPDDFVIHVTGDTGRADPALVRSAPANVVFTGYLPESEYQGLLAASDAVLGLTTQPNTLLCCAYEAVALRRPLILSRQEDLLSYFHRGVVPTDNTPVNLAVAIREAAARRDELATEVEALASVLSRDWETRFVTLSGEVSRLESAAHGSRAASR